MGLGDIIGSHVPDWIAVPPLRLLPEAPSGSRYAQDVYGRWFVRHVPWRHWQRVELDTMRIQARGRA